MHGVLQLNCHYRNLIGKEEPLGLICNGFQGGESTQTSSLVRPTEAYLSLSLHPETYYFNYW